ncbi:hypothetical protein AVEN_196476-1 [Araneus ventricosus]|uniref:Uncharacterized protein n=1 Tax=Araneus ventricosus TaxID=182803 RepID=A0A4Y2T138_ARAVE|nr:hypothetical protein AVEN_196476-1 [Araneus ventricosus]
MTLNLVEGKRSVSKCSSPKCVRSVPIRSLNPEGKRSGRMFFVSQNVRRFRYVLVPLQKEKECRDTFCLREKAARVSQHNSCQRMCYTCTGSTHHKDVRHMKFMGKIHYQHKKNNKHRLEFKKEFHLMGNFHCVCYVLI